MAFVHELFFRPPNSSVLSPSGLLYFEGSDCENSFSCFQPAAFFQPFSRLKILKTPQIQVNAIGGLFLLLSVLLVYSITWLHFRESNSTMLAGPRELARASLFPNSSLSGLQQSGGCEPVFGKFSPHLYFFPPVSIF